MAWVPNAEGRELRQRVRALADENRRLKGELRRRDAHDARPKPTAETLRAAAEARRAAAVATTLQNPHASRLALLRATAGMTQHQLAARANVSRKSVQRYEKPAAVASAVESGRWSHVRVRIARALGVTPEVIWPELEQS